MNILLTTINSKYIHQNLAIRLLYELNKNYEKLFWKEFINKDNLDEIAAYCSNYQIIAFSCYIWNISKILEVSKKIKEINPEIKILLGGPEVSYDWNDIIELKYIDFIIYGEGEIPFKLFLNSYPNIENVPNLVWKKNNEIIENKCAEVFDLKNLISINPYINDSTEELKSKITYIEASRGCPYKCGFCIAGLDNNVRYLAIESIQSNLLYLFEKAKIIKFLDRTFNSNTEFAIQILGFILKNYEKDNIFQFEIKADTPQPKLIEYIKLNVPKGVFRFEIGIQTLNPKANKEIKRSQNFENIKFFIQQISDKIEIHLDLIVGLPFDYYNDIKFSFDEVFKLFAPELQLGFLKFLKGTPIRNHYIKHDYIFDNKPPYQIIESNYLSKSEIQKITLAEQILEIYWNKKRTVNTLKYISLSYSIFDFFIDLGIYFEKQNEFKKFDIIEIYTIIFEYSKLNLHENVIILQLIAIDFYLQHKIKPSIRFLSEIDKPSKNKIIEKYQLNHHKFRYIMIPINFNFKKFVHKNIIKFSDELIIFQYDGINKPKIKFIKNFK